MTAGELLAVFRSEMNDDQLPYLWTDADVYRYIDDAQKMFCRNTDGIGDASTPAVVDIAVIPGTTWVNTHPSIRLMRRATRTDTGRPVEIVNFQDMADRQWFFDGRTGPVKALVIGEEPYRARVFPDSSETVTVRLLVYRMPLEIIEGDQDFEIVEKHHQHLLLWTKALAYLKQDAETYDKTKSVEFENKFLAYCEKSKLEDRKEKHKTRIVRYGGL